MIEELKVFINETGAEHYPRLLKKRKPEIFQWLMNQTAILDEENRNDNIKMSERIYYVLNGDQRFCEYGNRKRFYSINIGYRCSKNCKCVREAIENTNMKKYGAKCNLQCDDTKQKIKKTNIEKYGSENPSSLNIVKEKRKKTNLERYGVACSLMNDSVKEKTKKTNLERYGFELATQSPLIEQRRKLTNLKKFGKVNVFLCDDIKVKTKKTNLEKYGFEVALKNKDLWQKTKKTHEEKYGVSRPSQRPEILQKIKNTILERYGVDHFYKTHMTETTQSILYDKEIFVAFCENKSVTEVSKQLNVSTSFVNKKFNEFEVARKIKWQQENEILKFLNSLDKGLWKKDKNLIKPFEIDFLNEDLKIGIEYCGLFWHSDKHQKRHKKYHLNKTLMVEEKGYRLIQIFEDEWILKNDIVKARIKNIVGISEKGIGARKCNIKKITAKESKKFLNKNHLQGCGTGDFVRYGAFFKDVLIAVMTFSKPRLALGSKSSKDNSYELLRFSTDGRNYPGIASKILKNFIKDYDPEYIKTFADRRWSNGSLYKKLGFTEIKASPPNYWYFMKSSLQRDHRFKHRKNIIKHFVDDGDKKTEFQIQEERKYLRIWDCGNLKYEWRKK